MRKLALLLGSLVVVASASAKEVVPAPVVVEEAPVQIIEKEVIVYRDKEEGFRPNGYVDLQYKYYGDTEGQNEVEDGSWHKENNYSRIQLQGKINMTEKQAFEYRLRNYGDLDQETEKQKNGSDTRLRYFYNHGVLGDSKVNLTSRVHYRDREDKNPGKQEIEYQARFDFAEYLFNNDFIKTTSFILAPRYTYVWGDDNSSAYDNILGIDFYSTYDLPWGFSFEFNLYPAQHFYGDGFALEQKNGSKEDENFTVDMEVYLYNTTNLYTNGNVSVDFNFEGGYDAYSWSKEVKYDFDNEREPDDSTYSLYMTPTVQLNYQATPNLKWYVAAGAEYRNWEHSEESSASHWRWQPLVTTGFRTTF